MNYKQWYNSNTHDIVVFLHENGYTPHKLIEEATIDNISVWEYIYILYNI